MDALQMFKRGVEVKVAHWVQGGIKGEPFPCTLRDWLGMTPEEFGYYMLGDEYLLPILYSQEKGCSIEDAVALLMDS